MVMKKASTGAFETLYEEWLKRQLRGCSGERRRILASGLKHASKAFLTSVWWPAFSHFNGLSPECEVKDFKDGFRYIDFVWTLPGAMIAIEIDGYGPHWRNIDRWKFADHLFRQNHLILDDWKVIRLSYDDIIEHPRKCQQLFLHVLGKWGLGYRLSDAAANIPDPVDRAIMDFASRTSTPFSPAQAAKALGWKPVTIARHMNRLALAGLLLSARPGVKRIRKYILAPAK
ncbi:DNA-binding response regulator [Cohnella soli]|uniref:DNA-binding response regulator n=1 Tax=Cohnella soli TaxID=425005 RepID=A0ABW0HMJ8_9BACL